MKAIDPDDCTINDPIYPIGIRAALQGLGTANGLVVRAFEEEGTGPAHGISLRLESGRFAALYENLTLSQRNSDTTYIVVNDDPLYREEDAVEVLVSLDVRPEQVNVYHPELLPSTATLLRTDDHGVDYIVEDKQPLWRARLVLQSYERQQHKQLYWLRKS